MSDAAPPILLDGTPAFDAALVRLAGRSGDAVESIGPAVRAILDDVKREGESAVLRCVATFEKRVPAELVRTSFDGSAALARLDPSLRAALELAADRIRRYHEHQRVDGFSYEEEGVTLGVRVRPLARVGVYAPGGTARYPSSVLMAAIPARVAGVRDVVLATPAPDDALLAAAHLAGVTSILDAGGAHAIGALAYGLGSRLARVDKIVGPGSAYVTCAKRMVYGDVGIDMLAGPSEVLVLADDAADAAIVAADLLSQAEHDTSAVVVLVCASERFAHDVLAAIAAALPELGRRSIVERVLAEGFAILVVRSGVGRMVSLANAIGAEHVALHLAEPSGALDALRVAGAVLVGAATPVAAADYVAGPSHVLPTAGAARFASPLGVWDFVVRTSVVRYDANALRRHAPAIACLARAEGLDAHARAAEARRPTVSHMESDA